ncbi:hypothetical protein [Mesorhizobium sp. M0590]|uniref:hypothetical protein n=1 Tax=Mesorhizobium sp. M0590 TaxID=2956966 RepID=UPI003336A983
MPYSKVLEDGLVEVRLNGLVKWRIFGFFDRTVRREFVVVAIGNHKQNVYTPKGVLSSAYYLKKEIEAGREKADRCERPE